jgi:DNA processing protein
VVVVEGAEGSGSLITAEFAGDLHREVMAVPGPVTGPLSAAPHELIRDGATLVTSVGQVLAALGTPEGSWRSGWTMVPAQALAGLSEEERGVLDQLSGAPATVEVVAAGCGLDAPRTLRALAGLELRGLVRSEGGRYRRAGLEPGRGDL